MRGWESSGGETGGAKALLVGAREEAFSFTPLSGWIAGGRRTERDFASSLYSLPLPTVLGSSPVTDQFAMSVMRSGGAGTGAANSGSWWERVSHWTMPCVSKTTLTQLLLLGP